MASAVGVPTESSRLEAVKSHLKYGFAASLRSPDAVARTLGEAIAIAGRPEAINDLYAAYDRLTPDDLKRVAARYFLPTNETVVTLETEKKK